MKKHIILMLLFFYVGNSMAQEVVLKSELDSLVKSQIEKDGYKPSSTQFMIRGYGHTGFSYKTTNGEQQSSFDGGTFAPIFLFKHNDRFIFESELEFSLTSGELEVGFEYADMMYIVNDYITIRAGKFLLPFGTFMERLHPSWINRFTSKPLGFGHDGIAPSSDVGLEARGAFYIGNTKLTYSAYVTNGPTLKDGSIEAEEAGMLSFENLVDNNMSKAFGGRLGFFPFSDSSLELGVSGYGTNGTGDKGTQYENVGAFLYAFDLAYVKPLDFLYGLVDLKAQYNNSSVSNATYINTDDGTNYTYDNNSYSYYLQLSYRPMMFENNFFKNMEFVGRYSEYQTPEGAEWESNSSQYSYGINYWLSWRSVIKVSYEQLERQGGHESVRLTNVDSFSIHWAIGF